MHPFHYRTIRICYFIRWRSFLVGNTKEIIDCVDLHRRHSVSALASASFAAAAVGLRDALVIGDLVGKVDHEITGHIVGERRADIAVGDGTAVAAAAVQDIVSL